MDETTDSLNQCRCPRYAFIYVGCRPTKDEIYMADRICQKLEGSVDAYVASVPESGLIHEAGGPRERAVLLVETLKKGDIAVLMDTAPCGGESLGDSMICQILPFIPRNIKGVVVGGMNHAHFLTALSCFCPQIDAIAGLPSMQSNGESYEGGRDYIIQNFLEKMCRLSCYSDFVEEWNSFEMIRLAKASSNWRKTKEIEPYIMRPGSATGKVFAGNINSLWLLLDNENYETCRDGILFWEDRDLNPVALDRCLQKFGALGLMSQIRAMIIGVSRRFASSSKLDGRDDIVYRAVEPYGFPVAVNMFGAVVGDMPWLRLNKEASVTIREDGCFFCQ